MTNFINTFLSTIILPKNKKSKQNFSCFNHFMPVAINRLIISILTAAITSLAQTML